MFWRDLDITWYPIAIWAGFFRLGGQAWEAVLQQLTCRLLALEEGQAPFPTLGDLDSHRYSIQERQTEQKFARQGRADRTNKQLLYGEHLF